MNPEIENSDEELILGYARGDEASFQALYSRYSKKLFLFLWVRCGAIHGHLVDELFQKTWLKVHLARASFDASKRFSTWIFTIALNSLRDEVGAAHEKSPHEALGEDSQAAPQLSGEEICIHRDLIGRIYDFLLTLPENQRTALLLSDEDGLSSQEIGEILQLSDGAVRQHIRRARKHVREKFASEFSQDSSQVCPEEKV